MDKSKNKNSILEFSKISIPGYSIEFGDTTYENTLEERIQAAREASLTAKKAQKQNSKGKYSLKNSVNTTIENKTYFQNMTIKKTINNSQEFKKKNIQCWSSFSKNNFEPILNDSSLNTAMSKNINTNLHTKYNTNFSSKSTFKGGGLMQRRLELIKANKKLSHITPLENTALELNKCSNNVSNNLNCQGTPTKNYVPIQSDINLSKHKDNKNKLAIQKSIHDEVKYDHNRNINKTSNNLVTSVQNRLIRAKEEIIVNKFKFHNKNDNTKIGTVKNESAYKSVGIHQDGHALIYNFKSKNKILNHPNRSVNKKTIISNINNIISNNTITHKVINKQLVTVQKNPNIPNKIYNASETIVSPKYKNQDLLEKSKQVELNSFSFVLPKTSSVQQRLENFKKLQLSNDDSMEWEDIIESNNIVEKVNDIRKNTREYEPMEWTPDSILYADKINHCLVIDTNVLLSDLKSITIIIDKYLPEYGYLTIVLPWQVLQELDCIKKDESGLGYQAREATRWLLDMLSKNHPRLKGQPMTQKTSINPDDSILKCAIIVKEKVNIVNLVTNDKILSIKSEVSGIPVKNSIWLKNLVSVNNANESDIFQEAVKKYPIIDNKLIMKFEPQLEQFIIKILKFAVNHNNYATSIKQSWWKIYSLTPPLDLINCLLKLKEYWNVIAPQQLLIKSPKKQLDWLIIFFNELHQSSSTISFNWNELNNFLKYCTEVINILPYEYYQITDVLLNDLVNARRFLYHKLKCTSSTLNDESCISLLNNLKISSDNISNIENIFKNISEGVDTFCSYIYKANGLKRITSENELSIIFSKTMYSNKTIEDYCYKLSNIIKIMLKINMLEVEQILESDIIINEFLKAIINFDSDLKELNKESLIDYCLMKNRNSFINMLIFFQNNLAAMKNLLITFRNLNSSFTYL